MVISRCADNGDFFLVLPVANLTYFFKNDSHTIFKSYIFKCKHYYGEFHIHAIQCRPSNHQHQYIKWKPIIQVLEFHLKTSWIIVCISIRLSVDTFKFLRSNIFIPKFLSLTKISLSHNIPNVLSYSAGVHRHYFTLKSGFLL